MGVKEMAFGIGVVNMKGSEPPEMHYTNLWLPSRFASHRTDSINVLTRSIYQYFSTPKIII
jgi:hypothetical protein